MKWIKERDALIAQTKAFVQSVTGRGLDVAKEPPAAMLNRTEPVRTGALVAIAQRAATEAPAPFQSSESAERVIVPVLEAPPARVAQHSEVRKEIQHRIAAFQAHQHRFHREREAYFKSVLTKVRSAIENGPDTPSA